MKVYFVDVLGSLIEYDKVDPIAEGLNMRPQDGCDMLIRNALGGVFSAKSSSYYSSKETALREFLARQQKYIDQAQERLLLENRRFDNAARQLDELISEETEE